MSFINKQLIFRAYDHEYMCNCGTVKELNVYNVVCHTVLTSICHVVKRELLFFSFLISPTARALTPDTARISSQ